jgi:PPP family 3-phenylpropionic acid transporter
MPVSVRLAIAYVAIFLCVGVYLPFWPVWLASRGMDPDRIGVLLGLTTWAYLWAPWVGARAEGGDARRWITGLALGMAAGLAIFEVADGFAWLLCGSIVLGLAFAPIVPLTDGLTLRAAVDYGRVRLFGSLAFIVASVGGGFALEGRAPGVVLVTVQAIAIVILAASLALPRVQQQHVAAKRSIAWRELLALPGFVAFLVNGACLQAGHAVLYAFGTKHWLASGIDARTIGWLWAVGVIAEIGLFAVGERVVARIGAKGLLVASAIAQVVRWTLLANVSAVGALFAIQLLHGATFGALHLGAMHWMRSNVERDAIQRATTLYTAIAGGLALGLGLLAAGFLYERLRGDAFLAMAGLGVLGLAAAVRLRTRRGAHGGRADQRSTASSTKLRIRGVR